MSIVRGLIAFSYSARPRAEAVDITIACAVVIAGVRRQGRTVGSRDLNT
jgi:hypothetical protein